MTSNLAVLPHPKDRRRVARANGRHTAAHGSVPAKTNPETKPETNRNRPEEAQEHRPTFLETCWPTVFGILLAIIAERLRMRVIRDWGDAGDRFVFAFVRLFARPELGLGVLGDSLSQLMLHLQFPLTGLYATWNLRRHHKLSTTLLQIGFVYGVIAFVLWLMTSPGASHGL